MVVVQIHFVCLGLTGASGRIKHTEYDFDNTFNTMYIVQWARYSDDFFIYAMKSLHF